MNDYFIGKMPAFDNYNLFSEKPIVAILETEGVTEECPDGSRTIRGGKFKVSSFDRISDAVNFRKEHEDPDKAPTKVKIYAFFGGEWMLVSCIADSI